MRRQRISGQILSVCPDRHTDGNSLSTLLAGCLGGVKVGFVVDGEPPTGLYCELGF